MAPMAAMGKKRLLELLAQRGPPISFGSPHASTAVVQQDGVFRLRELVVDPTESRAAFEEARAKQQSFMPENLYALGRPTGKIWLESETLEGLMKLIGGFSWPTHW